MLKKSQKNIFRFFEEINLKQQQKREKNGPRPCSASRAGHGRKRRPQTG
jgi:hypothetical protein